MEKTNYIRTLVNEIHERLHIINDCFAQYDEPLSASSLATKEESTQAIIRSCIGQLMEVNIIDSRGRIRPLFNKASHWQAIYRILADFGLGATDGDYIGFATYAATLMPCGCRIPFSYQALRDISKTPFVRPFAKWQYDCTYFQTRIPYDSMYQVASTFLKILKENGLVKS